MTKVIQVSVLEIIWAAVIGKREDKKGISYIADLTLHPE